MWQMTTDWTEIVLILAVIGIGSVIHGLTGFGFALVTMGIVCMYYSVLESTLIVLALNAVFMVPMIVKYVKYIQVKPILWIMAGALAGSSAGFFFLDAFGELDWLKRGLGLLLLAMTASMLFKRKEERAPRSDWLKKPAVVTGIGFLGGFIGAVFAVGGPFFVMYFLLRFPDKKEYSVNLQLLFLISISYTMILHGTSGNLDPTFWFYVVAGTPIVLLGAYFGIRGFERINRTWLERLTFAVIALSGLQLLIFT